VRFPRATHLLIGVIGPHEDAKHVLAQITAFLQEALHLQVAEEKSGVHHAKAGSRFLGYEVRVHSGNRVVKTRRKATGTVYTMRSVSERLQLHVPKERGRTFGHTKGYGDYDRLIPHHKPTWLERSDVEILLAYNAELRGLANYYGLADDAKSRLDKLAALWQGSLLKTLANKHKTQVNAIVKQLRHGRDLVYRYTVQGKERRLKVFALKDRKPPRKTWETVDVQPPVALFTLSRTEIVRRLNAERCEYCGKDTGYFEVHHVRHLRDVQGKAFWQQRMAAMRRKTLVLCIACHEQLHHGILPDWRAQPMRRRAGFMET